MIATRGETAGTSPGVPARIDHLVYAAPNLGPAIEAVERLLGVRTQPGGSHPGRGTRNALLSLGPDVYLEIIGPDRDQPEPARRRMFGIDELDAAKLATWAMKDGDLERRVRDAGRHGIDLGAIQSGGRQRPDGVVLSWRLTRPPGPLAGGIVPFFIDWGDTLHPARGVASGVRLLEFRAEHPDAEGVRRKLVHLGIDLRVEAGPRPALVAVLQGPNGRVELR